MELIILFLVWIVIGSVLTVIFSFIMPDNDILDDAFFKTLHVIFWPITTIYYFIIGILHLTEKAFDILRKELPRLYREWKVQQGWK